MNEKRKKIKNKRSSARAMLRRNYGSIKKAKIVLLRKTNGKCWICKRSLSDLDVTIDHIKPLAKGGTNYWYNLMPACWSCNQKERLLSNL